MNAKSTTISVLFVFISALTLGQDDVPTSPPVGVSIVKPVISVTGNIVVPFIQTPMFGDGEKYEGFTIDYLDALFNEMNMEYTFTQRSLQDSLESVRSGESRIGAAAISITAKREVGLDFVPVFNSGLGIMVSELDKMSNIPIFLSLIGHMVFVLFIYVVFTGHIVWIFEKGNPSFNDKYFPGVFEGMWWTIVTMSTVGYGDFFPKTWRGRGFATFTIFCGIVMFGWILSEVDAIKSKTLEYRIKSTKDLNGKKVAVKFGTTSEESARIMGALVEPVDVIEKAYYLLRDGKVDAVIYDWPVLAHYALNDGVGHVHLMKEMFDKQAYGLAFKEGDPLQEQAKRAHLRIVENGVYDQIYRKYFNGV